MENQPAIFIETLPRDASSFVPEIQYNDEAFNEIVLYDKALDISKQLQIDIEPVIEVLRWGIDKLGHQELRDYLDETILTINEIIAGLGLAKVALAVAGQSANLQELQDKHDSWQLLFDTYVAEYRPSLKARYLQLADLKQQEQKLYSVLTDDSEDKNRVVKYPEEMRLVRVSYEKIYNDHMPAYGQNDTTSGRITDINGNLANIYGGEVHVSNHLLDAVRGFITPLDTQYLAALKGKSTKFRTGIDHAETPIGELAHKSSQMANFGLMLIAKKLHSRQELQVMSNETGVDCLGAGLAEGLAMCSYGYARIGDIVGFPKWIPNSEDDYYCGLKVEQLYDPNNIKCRLTFNRWKAVEDESPNCLLAVTSNVASVYNRY